MLVPACSVWRGDRVQVAARRDVGVAAADVVAGDAALNAAQVDGAEADAERAAEGLVGDDDARLDQHLADGDVDLGDQRLHLLELGRDVGDEQLVGAGLEHDGCRAATGSARADPTGAARGRALPGQPVGDVIGLCVVELERLRAERLERRDLLLGLELDLLLGVELVLGRDQDHVARLAQAEALRLQDDVERLVPGHVLQAQRHVAGDGVAGDDVEVGEVGDDLQQRADLDVLEVERELLAGVARALHQLVRIDLLRPHFEHELVVALVGAVLPGAARLDDHAHAVARLRRRDALHRRAEVGDVEAAAQRVGQARAQELDDQALALLADVDADLVVRQLDDDAAGAVGAAPEVDVAQRQRRAVQALGEARRLRRSSSPASPARCSRARRSAPCLRASRGSRPAP